MLTIVLSILPWVILAAVIIAVLCMGYVKAPPDMAYIITGLHRKPRILVGKAGIRIPFFERVDKLFLGAFQVDVKTNSSVPTIEFINIKIDSTVSVRVSQDPELLTIAAQNFLNVSKDEIARRINDLLEGNLREIAGTMTLTSMVNDRKAFSEKVQENAVPDLRKLGLELVSFNVQNFLDDGKVIENLGIDNVAQISKNAAIARSNADREVEVARAENAKQANDAKVKAQEEIAVRNADLAQKQAALQRTVDTEQARADAAKQIEAENQRKLRDVAATDANIAKAERETALKQKQIELKEYELDAVVRKQADAEKYAAEKKAEADLIRRQKEAEAKKFEIEQQALAIEAKAKADRFAAEQQAAGIAAIGEAEAAAIEKKAEAQKKMEGASVLEMYFNALPKIVASAAGPLENVESITMYGNGNTEQLVGEVMRNANQIQNAVKEATGIDLAQMIGDLWKKPNNE